MWVLAQGWVVPCSVSILIRGWGMHADLAYKYSYTLEYIGYYE